MSLDGALAALSDPTRRRLVERLAKGPTRAGALADGFSISRPGVTKHLGVLVDAGLVDVERQGRMMIYRLSPGGIDPLRKWMDEASQMWDQALDSLKRYAERRVV